MRHWQKWAAPGHQIQRKLDPAASERRGKVVDKLIRQGFTRVQAERHYDIYGLDR